MIDTIVRSTPLRETDLPSMYCCAHCDQSIEPEDLSRDTCPACGARYATRAGQPVALVALPASLVAAWLDSQPERSVATDNVLLQRRLRKSLRDYVMRDCRRFGRVYGRCGRCHGLTLPQPGDASQMDCLECHLVQPTVEAVARLDQPPESHG